MQFTKILLVFLAAVPLYGQIDLPAALRSQFIDFGAVSGTWGHLQYHRPYGARGIILQDWKDLTTLHPLNGEFLNTDLRGWYPQDPSASYWERIHPELVAPQDTTAPSLVVNYKQGDGDYSDFTGWYHNALGRSTRYGWTSKLRTHKRYLDYSSHYDQRHRLYLDHRLDTKKLVIEVDYAHQFNPLYILELNSGTQLFEPRTDHSLLTDRWSGSLQVVNDDSLEDASELFLWLEGGRWEWSEGKRNSVSSMALYSRELSLGSSLNIMVKLGLLNGTLGAASSTRHFAELLIPLQMSNRLNFDIGLRNVGRSEWLPTIVSTLNLDWLDLGYRTQHLMTHQLWDPEFNSELIHLGQADAHLGAVNPFAGAWASGSGTLSGYYGGIGLRLPWKMAGQVKYSESTNTNEWIWASKQLEWELEQEFILFKQALHGHLRLWGRHLYDLNVGEIDPGSLKVNALPGELPGKSPLHLLNYTISGQISKLVIAYTGSNALQDPTLDTVSGIPWETSFSILNNQASDNRFRYFSLIWVFDN